MPNTNMDEFENLLEAYQDAILNADWTASAHPTYERLKAANDAVEAAKSALLTYANGNAAVSLGRLGGKARAASLTSEERSDGARKAISAYWAAMTPKQRTAEMKRRAAKRKPTPTPYPTD